MKERIFHSLYDDEFSKFDSLHLAASRAPAECVRNAAQGVRRFEREC